MTSRLHRRGPDADGIWQSADGAVNLGHRRLSILDPSDGGAQPMAAVSGGGVIVFNGEIYNFQDLRATLAHEGVSFRSTSDTEVLLSALCAWGVEATLPRLNGMFAFAFWDERTRQLYLARDRFGEKPLYYGFHQGSFLFGSELKALREHPAFVDEIDREAVTLFMRFNYVPWPHSIYKHAKKLQPGTFLRVKCTGELEQKRYWSLSATVSAQKRASLDVRDPALIDQVDAVLRRAVALRMVADVPLGAFLSGGIDSSTIVSLMQAQSSRPIKTFTIGFWEAPHNEAEDAAKVARHLGTEHHELYLSSRECADVIVDIPEIYDEPFADSSQIPTTLVSAFTRRHVTVALSGDAGDELFGGYNRYFWTMRIWPVLRAMPLLVRRQLAKGMQSFSPEFWDHTFSHLNPFLPAKLRVRGAGEKLHKVAAALGAQGGDDLYRAYVSQWLSTSEVLVDGVEPPFLAAVMGGVPPEIDYIERMMYLDSMTYLPSDILCKVDRASMWSGLEARVPFLDNDVVDLAWRLPVEFKIKGGVGKWPLRQVLNRYVPSHLVERPKTGFGIPIGDWLRGPLRDWAEDLLSERSLDEVGWFRTEVVRRKWVEHLSGRFNRQHSLWSVLMLCSWLRKYRIASPTQKLTG